MEFKPDPPHSPQKRTVLTLSFLFDVALESTTHALFVTLVISSSF